MNPLPRVSSSSSRSTNSSLTLIGPAAPVKPAGSGVDGWAVGPFSLSP
jgi:hypothetical protein